MLPCTQTHTHKNTEDALRPCVQKRVNNLDGTRAHTSAQTRTASLVSEPPHFQVRSDLQVGSQPLLAVELGFNKPSGYLTQPSPDPFVLLLLPLVAKSNTTQKNDSGAGRGLSSGQVTVLFTELLKNATWK